MDVCDIPAKVSGTLIRNDDDQTFTLTIIAYGDDGAEDETTVRLPFATVAPLVPMVAPMADSFMASALPPEDSVAAIMATPREG